MDAILIGFQTALSLTNVWYCFVGVLLGTVIGVLPGIGPLATIAMLLPLTVAQEPSTALIMLAGIYYGAQYGGSTTAILVNLPGEAASAVTSIDGYRMARNGRAGAALGIAAIGSFIAGSLATLVIAIMGPLLASVALKFGPAEYFSLVLFGLIASVSLARGSVIKALAMIGFGILLGLMGTDVYTGRQRFNFGLYELYDGPSIVAIAIGLFGVSEILHTLGQRQREVEVTTGIGTLLPTRDDMNQAMPAILRGTMIGSLLGILPGGGALMSSFASYTMEKRLSKTPERFGSGAIEGVAGPESANNAGAQTSFIPMLTLGIPSSPIMALMVGAMILQGIQPGPNIMTDRPDLFWGLIVSMWVGNAMLVVLNLPLVGFWARLIQVPYNVLFPAIVIFSAIGVFSVDYSSFDMFVMVIAGLVGYFFLRVGCEPAPLLVGFVLGPMLEDHLRRALIMSRGDIGVLFTQPISAFFLLLSVFLLAATALPYIRRKRETIFVEE